MSGSKQAEWYIAVEGEPFGPVSPTRLSELVLGGKVLPHDLVWCEGMIDWRPLSATLGGGQKSRPGPVVYEIDVEAAERRELAGRVASLSELYLDKLVELGGSRSRRPAVHLDGARSQAGIEASTATARYIDIEPAGRGRNQSRGRLEEARQTRGPARELPLTDGLLALSPPV